MGITLLQIDKSGRIIDQKDYSIVVVRNNVDVFGVNVPQIYKDKLLNYFNKGLLGKMSRFRFLIRFHTAVLIQILNESLIYLKNIIIEMCNDFDGHYHEIKNMLISNNLKLINSEFIIAKFPKPSKIDSAGQRFRNKKLLKTDVEVKLNFDDLFRIIKK